ncbi:hypothetical protein ACPXCE_19360 [Streptomyces sp. DT24]|uniref:hypothetical protein n=1 Tax=Streptomyces sp. DT24 TaxID=3416520 RepID=UPI003CE98B9F
MPEPCGVPQFAPFRVRGGGGHRLRRAVRRRRCTWAAGLALTAAALAASGLGGAAAGGSGGPPGTAGAGGPPSEGGRHAELPVSTRLVSAPVRIADAAAVRLLRTGDRVDVIAAGSTGAEARVVARDVRVAEVPPMVADDPAQESGALVVLSVGRDTAKALAGAAVSGRLAVTLCGP